MPMDPWHVQLTQQFCHQVLDFERLRLRGCGFIVAGRVDASDGGSFKGLDDVEFPPELEVSD